jgi:hypothetical protein
MISLIILTITDWTVDTLDLYSFHIELDENKQILKIKFVSKLDR